MLIPSIGRREHRRTDHENSASRSALPPPPSGVTLTRQFAVLSLLIIGLITAALCVTIAHYLKKSLLEREWKITASYVHTEAVQHLTATDFAEPWSPRAQERFAAFYQQTVAMPEIMRVKIYDATLMVVWSDEAHLIGRRFADNPQLLGAMAGQTVVHLATTARKREHLFEGKEFPELVEVYVPIKFAEAAPVAGIVETYKAPTTVFANIRQGQLVVLQTALAGSLLLYTALFWIVRRAAWRINEQHATLARQRQDLTVTNQELRAVQSQLLEAERLAAIGEVVTAVAHGIRNPLANIRAAAQVATLDCHEGHEAGAASKNLRHIMAEVDRLEARLKELLQFVRPAQRQSVPVDLNTVVREARQMLVGRLSGTSIRLEERLTRPLPGVLGDPMLFEQIVLSLIANALDALSTGGGRLTLRTGTAPDTTTGVTLVFAEVQDTGGGIAPHDMPKIFAPFYTTKAQGTGLGLAIAKKFTEAYGGTIEVTSHPGQGTTFRVMFPAQAER